MAQRRQRAVEHIGGMAAIDHGAIAQQLDLETCELGHPIGGAAEAGRILWREQQRAVQAIDDDGVGGREIPARKHRLHDLEALCHPVDATEQRRLVHSFNWLNTGARGRLHEGESDFVVLDPSVGLLFVEVKGGSLEFDPRNGIWYHKLYSGRSRAIKSDPFVQARKSAGHQGLRRVA